MDGRNWCTQSLSVGFRWQAEALMSTVACSRAEKGRTGHASSVRGRNAAVSGSGRRNLVAVGLIGLRGCASGLAAAVTVDMEDGGFFGDGMMPWHISDIVFGGKVESTSGWSHRSQLRLTLVELPLVPGTVSGTEECCSQKPSI